jgi:radical SAM/Cys-rich protein
LPLTEKFSLTPNQVKLEQDYKKFLKEHFDIDFNQLFTITNLPVGRSKFHLQRTKLYAPYLQFLEGNFNGGTVEHLMCRDELSIDYLGNVYDCDFNQMENLAAESREGQTLTVGKLLEAGSLDLIEEIRTASYCYGCTAGCGSSCGGALV